MRRRRIRVGHMCEKNKKVPTCYTQVMPLNINRAL
jgi:hypothetical protein